MQTIALLFGRASMIVLLLAMFAPNSLSQVSTITTYAGATDGVRGKKALAYAIGIPMAVTPDSSGGFYFISNPRQRVYRISADGSISLVLGEQIDCVADCHFGPQDLTLDFAGNLYVADTDNHRIRKVTPDGVITTIAGNGTPGYSGDNGPATAARLKYPSGIAVDRAGNLYIADTFNECIRKVTPNGVIVTIAGNGTPGFSGDGGPALNAQLFDPRAVAVDSTGNVYVADHANIRIRKVSPDGVITTVAGNGRDGYDGDGGPATAAQLTGPSGIAIDSLGNLYISAFDSEPVPLYSHTVRKVSPVGVITTVAGKVGAGYSGDGGPATIAELNSPRDVAVDPAGNLYIADSFNFRVRRVAADGTIRTVAGNGSFCYSEADISAVEAQLCAPAALALDKSGNLFITDGNYVRKIAPDGSITRVAGTGNYGYSGDGGPAISAEFNYPRGLAVDAAGDLYISDTFNLRIRKVSRDGFINTVVGTGRQGAGGDGGPATNAQLRNPEGLAFDAKGNLFIAEADGHRIRKVTADGVITTVAGTGEEICGHDGPAAANHVAGPSALASDGMDVYIASTGCNRILKLTADGVIRTVAGSGTPGYGGDGGSATAAELLNPRGLAVDFRHNLYIADYLNARIRKVMPDGSIITVAGTGVRGYAGDGGPAALAQISYPWAIAADAAGALFVADPQNRNVRRIDPPATYTIAGRGGVSWTTTGGSSPAIGGYARLRPNGGSPAVSGLAIMGFVRNNVLIGETTAPASPLVRTGRIAAQINDAVNTALAIANPNEQAVTVSFYFTTVNGSLPDATVSIPARGQIAAFLDRSPFNARAPLDGTLTFSASLPVAALALRGLTNQRGELLITMLPLGDLSIPLTIGSVVFPHFADGGGWTTEITLVNPSEAVLTGTIQFVGQSGTLVNTIRYSIPPRASQTVRTPGSSATAQAGSVRVVPAADGIAPVGSAVFSFQRDGVTGTEASVPAVGAKREFRLYAEIAAVQTGLAISNPSSTPATVSVEFNRLDGSSLGVTGIVNVPANGQAAAFLDEIQKSGVLPAAFQGVLRISSVSPISVVGFRARYNERNDFLLSTVLPISDANTPANAELLFPHFADGGGYTTQFVLFSGSTTQQSTGTLRLFSQSGEELDLPLRP